MLWSHHLKKQWSFGDLIAVRVQDANGLVLGSTIPMPFAALQEGQSAWGVSWINADPVVEPGQRAGGVEVESSVASNHADNAKFEDEDSSPAEPQKVTSVIASAPFHSVDVVEGQGPPQLTASPKGSEEAPQQSPALDVASGGSAASPSLPPSALPFNTLAANEQLPSVTAAEEAKESGDEAGAQVNDGSASFSASTGAALATPTAGAPRSPVSAPAATSPIGAAKVAAAADTASAGLQGGGGGGVTHVATHRSASSTMPWSLQPDVRPPTFSKCLPISIKQASKGPLSLDVITASGTKLAIAEADIQATLHDDVSGSPVVHHYAVVVAPLKAKPQAKQDNAVYAVLEFSVVIGSTDSDTAILMSVSALSSSVPTSLEIGNTCAFSSRTFYYPPKFLTGTGDYIVTNVLCVESRSDNPVQLTVALPDSLKNMGVLPDKMTVIQRRGDRAFFTFTWGVFDAYVDIDANKDIDADRSTVSLHLLIRDGTQNRAPVEIALIGDLPLPQAKNTGPFMFYVNHAKVSNISCSPIDSAILADFLPISLVTRAGT
ncbi:hypothetical protein ABL78_7672 [Leptomonas seymouri]|uniref:Uncharacterized protein n=1 Tax=Leptomonas seymouri TaxID=5684 RepID=A0A0N1PC61_LEPSE|nr:hypothetical protein ABL78_7672 [Leptomonas seymouri]|eukprot:KPI83291.1 hypothetical protein ABL78_7672 [Leptomonas seymouri]